LGGCIEDHPGPAQPPASRAAKAALQAAEAAAKAAEAAEKAAAAVAAADAEAAAAAARLDAARRDPAAAVAAKKAAAAKNVASLSDKDRPEDSFGVIAIVTRTRRTVRLAPVCHTPCVCGVVVMFFVLSV
jgi:hypothetical protein